MLDSRPYCCLCFHVIRWIQNYHSRDRSHQGDILITLVGSPILSYGDTRMGSSDLYIQLRIGNRVANLLKSTSCGKHSKRTSKRNLTGSGKSRCNTNHITLCDTTVNVSVRKCFLEHSRLCSSGKIRIQNNQVLKFCSQLCQGISITLTSRNLFYFTHRDSPTFSKSAIACAYCSSFGAAPCQLA